MARPKTTPRDAEIGALLKAKRIKKGRFRNEVAAALDISYQQLMKYEKGQDRISLARFEQYCRALGISPQEFFYPSSPINHIKRLNGPEDRELTTLCELYGNASVNVRKAVMSLLQFIKN